MIEPLDPEKLLDELGRLAERGVARTFQHVEKAGPVDLRELSKIIRYLYPTEWAGTEEQRVDAVKSTIQGVLDAKAFSNRICPVSQGRIVIWLR